MIGCPALRWLLELALDVLLGKPEQSEFLSRTR